MKRATGVLRLRPLSEEFVGAQLGDERLNRRLDRLADQLAERATESFPKALADESQLEAAYRFFGNTRVKPEAILEPHFVSSAKRAAAQSSILVIHDTTEFEFGGNSEREGLGRLLRPGQGFFGHFSLAVQASATHAPLGLLGLESIFRHTAAIPRKKRKKKHDLGESARWARAVESAQARLAPSVRAIHLMDREGDSFAILNSLDERGRDYVIRSNHDRVLADVADQTHLRSAARGTTPVIDREVSLSYRPVIHGPKGKRHPARDARIARLTFAATRVSLPRTSTAKGAGTERPARDALTASHVAVLRAVSKAPLPQKLSVSDALLAIARLGGHIRANGEPGWLVLARGFRDLLLLERGWSARPRERSDQS